MALNRLLFDLFELPLLILELGDADAAEVDLAALHLLLLCHCPLNIIGTFEESQLRMVVGCTDRVLVLDEAAGLSGEDLAMLRILQSKRLLQHLMVTVAANGQSPSVLQAHLSIQDDNDGGRVVSGVNDESIRQAALLAESAIVRRQGVVDVAERGHLVALEHQLGEQGS